MRPDPARHAAADADFIPAAPRHRHDGWNAAKQHTFIRALAVTGSVRAACDSPGVEMSTYSAYALRRHTTGRDFARVWDAALGAGMAALHDEAFDRAYNGIVEDVYYKGEVVGQRYVRSEKLLMFLLANRGLMANRNFSSLGPARGAQRRRRLCRRTRALRGGAAPPDRRRARYGRRRRR